MKEYVTFWLETQYGEDNIRNKSIDWRVILKWNFENRL
jgi:hypothetical protein